MYSRSILVHAESHPFRIICKCINVQQQYFKATTKSDCIASNILSGQHFITCCSYRKIMYFKYSILIFWLIWTQFGRHQAPLRSELFFFLARDRLALGFPPKFISSEFRSEFRRNYTSKFIESHRNVDLDGRNRNSDKQLKCKLRLISIKKR
jgi:hypothetical protein